MFAVFITVSFELVARNIVRLSTNDAQPMLDTPFLLSVRHYAVVFVTHIAYRRWYWSLIGTLDSVVFKSKTAGASTVDAIHSISISHCVLQC